MRKLLIVCVVCLAVVGPAFGATVVLKGGKQLQVESYERDGNLLVVRYGDGRLESYPLVAVDLEATEGVASPFAVAEPEPEPVVPHSPFFGAQAPEGQSAVVMTDEDVMHVPDAADALSDQGEGQASGSVVISGYQKTMVQEGSWEITANVLNQGSSMVSNITASISLLDMTGQLLGAGTGSFAGTLAPGQQGIITSQIEAPAEPAQITFNLRWQTIDTVSSPEVPVVQSQATTPAQTQAAPQQAQPVSGYSVPAGSSPMAMPTNPLAMPPITDAPYVPQAPRGTPPPAGGGGEVRS